MNQDAHHDSRVIDIPSSSHSEPDPHLIASPHPLNAHQPTELDVLSSLHSGLLNPLGHDLHIHEAHHAVLGSQMIGEPDSGGVWHEQQTPFTCAVVSQEMILREYGINVNEAHLMGEAMQHGWLNAEGTPFEDMGKLLDLHGVPCHEGQGIDQMLSELSQGHKLIVGVDSTILWHGDSWVARELHSIFDGKAADHAIVVQGLSQDSSGGWHVIVNDPGDPNGAGHDYPLDQFRDAWEGSDCHFIATDVPPHDLASDFSFGRGFDEQTGTYPEVLEWLRYHSDALAIGAAVAIRSNVPCKPLKSEEKRNDILRQI